MENIRIIILGIVIIAFFFLMFYYAYKYDKLTYWFKSLKPGDKVSVTIYSNYCNCDRNATVTKSIDEDNFIEAKMDDDTLNKCKECSLMKAINNKGENTCWYHVNSFSRENVNKI